MAETRFDSRYLRFEDGTVWPDPADPDEIAWRLRYGEPTKADLMAAASAMAAYEHLIFHPAMTQKKRNALCKRLREASEAKRAQAERGSE